MISHLVVIHGPPGSGKSLNAEACRKVFGLDTVINDIGLHSPSMLEEYEGSLLATDTRSFGAAGYKLPRAYERRAKVVTILSVEEMKIAMGSLWVEPVRGFR